MTSSATSSASPSASPATPITTPVTLSRRYPAAPMVGVGVAIYNTEGQVLLVQRGRPPRQGTWGLPGGLIDLGEHLADAARREVMEELGLTIELGTLATTFETILRDDEGQVEYHYVVLEYWAHYLGGTPLAQDDAAAFVWASVTELDRYALTPHQHQVLAQTFAAWRAAAPPHSQSTRSL